MKWLTGYTEVSFPGLNLDLNVYENLVEFTIPGWDIDITIKFYGVIIAFGFILAVLFGGRMAYKWKTDLNKMLDILIYGTFAAIIGARLYYILFSLDHYIMDNLWDTIVAMVSVWNGGLAIYGGIIAGAAAGIIVARKKKMNILQILDYLAPAVMLAQAIGRWGNFFNGEAHGEEVSLEFLQKLHLPNFIIEGMHATISIKFSYRRLFSGGHHV